MRHRMLISCLFAVIMLTQTGCAGLAVLYPAECTNESPVTTIHNIFWKGPGRDSPPPAPSTKAEFRTEWGEPVEIYSLTEDRELWVYTKNLWCGAIPVFILPVPLILPMCDGFDRIEFQGETATRLHTRHTVSAGLVIGLVMGGGSDPACRYPLPAIPAAPLQSATPSQPAPAH